MKNMLWIVIVTLLAVLFTHTAVFAKDCPAQTKLEDRYFLRSEDLGDKPGLYTVKKLDGSDVRVIMAVVQHLLTFKDRKTEKNEFKLEEVKTFKYSIIHRKDVYEVVILTGRNEGGLDGLGIINYKVDPKDFSIKSMAAGIWIQHY